MVLAGGHGQRFGAPKQFALLGDRPLLDWSLDAARGVAHEVVLVLPEHELSRNVPRPGVVVVAGGATRAASVRAGLDAVPEDAEVVVIHDAARPLATPALFRHVVEVLLDEEHPVDGVIPALRVTDTVKKVVDDRVISTIPREDLVAVQTPQAFRASVLRHAHASAGEATDDAALLEEIGATVGIVPGETTNLKVTTPSDLVVAAILAAR